MKIDVYTATGTKKGTATLPVELFAVEINDGLMHQALVRQQSNRRHSIAHVKSRGEVRGSTRKLYQQKGTGRARRGSVRSPVLRGGGKAFGPRNNTNFVKDMPRKMRRKAIACCLSAQAKAGTIFGLENFNNEHKTKQFVQLLQKLPVDIGRRITIVLPAKHEAVQFAARNVGRVRVITAEYLNPEDVMQANHLIFVGDSIERAVELFAADLAETTAKAPAAKKATTAATKAAPKKAPAAKKAPAKTATKKAAPKVAAKPSTKSTK